MTVTALRATVGWREGVGATGAVVAVTVGWRRRPVLVETAAVAAVGWGAGIGLGMGGVVACGAVGAATSAGNAPLFPLKGGGLKGGGMPLINLILPVNSLLALVMVHASLENKTWKSLGTVYRRTFRHSFLQHYDAYKCRDK